MVLTTFKREQLIEILARQAPFNDCTNARAFLQPIGLPPSFMQELDLDHVPRNNAAKIVIGLEDYGKIADTDVHAVMALINEVLKLELSLKDSSFLKSLLNLNFSLHIPPKALLKTLAGHSSVVTNVAWSPNGELLASSSCDKTVKLWNSTGKLVCTLEGHFHTVDKIAWSPNSQLLASSSNDGTVKVWNTSGMMLATMQAHSELILSLAWSPNSQLLASSSNDDSVKVWDASGKLVASLIGHTAKVLSLAWSPDGQLLASASADYTVKLWKRDLF